MNSMIIKCSKCGVELYELVPGTYTRKIFRSFATEIDGKCTCINCHDGKTRKENDGQQSESTNEKDIL